MHKINNRIIILIKINKIENDYVKKYKFQQKINY